MKGKTLLKVAGILVFTLVVVLVCFAGYLASYPSNLLAVRIRYTLLGQRDFSGTSLGATDYALWTVANLSEADLCEADLFEADLSGSNLTEAVLTEAHLFEATLREVDLSNADLEDADLSGTIMPDGTVHD